MSSDIILILMEEGWYLMSTSDLEHELLRWRSEPSRVDRSNAVRLSVQEAIAYRNAGNLPDEMGRTLRLVLHAGDGVELKALSAKRLLYEPDYHEAPTWRREGSKPVNVVPLRSHEAVPDAPKPWWEEPELAELEAEWASRGTVHGLVVPGPYRSFVYKTVLALKAAGKEISADTVADSIARWLPEDEAERLRSALKVEGSG